MGGKGAAYAAPALPALCRTSTARWNARSSSACSAWRAARSSWTWSYRVIPSVTKDGRRAPCRIGPGQGRRRRREAGRRGANFGVRESKPARAGMG